MTIIQVLKRIKQLGRKIERNHVRIARWCSYFSNEEPMYGPDGINKMLQANDDMQNEIARLKHILHHANATMELVFEGKSVTIDELILEATVTIPAKLKALTLLRRKEKSYQHDKDVKVVVQYDPKDREKKLDALEERKARINDFLDEANISVTLEV